MSGTRKPAPCGRDDEHRPHGPADGIIAADEPLSEQWCAGIPAAVVAMECPHGQIVVPAVVAEPTHDLGGYNGHEVGCLCTRCGLLRIAAERGENPPRVTSAAPTPHDALCVFERTSTPQMNPFCKTHGVHHSNPAPTPHNALADRLDENAQRIVALANRLTANEVAEVVDSLWDAAAVFRSLPTAADEPKRSATDDLVDRFAVALKAKLRAAEAKYEWNDGWKNDGWADDLRARLREHVKKGDPRDVATFCAFAWHHGWSVGAAPDEPKRYSICSAHQAAEPDCSLCALTSPSPAPDGEAPQTFDVTITQYRERAEKAEIERMLLASEVTRLRGIVAAVEALPEKWRECDAQTAGDAGCVGGNSHTSECSNRRRCADELNAALKGADRG